MLKQVLKILWQLCFIHAEAPSLTSYKDKSDEFSLSVPASKSPTTSKHTHLTPKRENILHIPFVVHMEELSTDDTCVAGRLLAFGSKSGMQPTVCEVLCHASADCIKLKTCMADCGHHYY